MAQTFNEAKASLGGALNEPAPKPTKLLIHHSRMKQSERIEMSKALGPDWVLIPNSANTVGYRFDNIFVTDFASREYEYHNGPDRHQMWMKELRACLRNGGGLFVF